MMKLTYRWVQRNAAMHSAQVDNYGPEVMSRLSKILPGETCCMPQHSQGPFQHH